jgi:hypothetical protein
MPAALFGGGLIAAGGAEVAAVAGTAAVDTALTAQASWSTGGLSGLCAAFCGRAQEVVADLSEGLAPGSGTGVRGPVALAQAERNAEIPAVRLATGSLGSKGRTEAANLKEQLAMQEVLSNPGGRQLQLQMTDEGWLATDRWVKMAQDVNGVEIHYVLNTLPGAVDDFMFK